MKAVSFSACEVTGIAYNVSLCVGCWTRKINLTIVPLDDFDIILGIEFFKAAKVSVMSYLNGMMINYESIIVCVMLLSGKWE